MKRALVSFGVGGGFEELLHIAAPSFQAFADRHGYDFLIPELGELARPASWHKVPALLDVLETHDEVLWVDADAVIVDDSRDVKVPQRCWHALVVHHTGDGQVPGAGFWYLRRPMIAVLERMWTRTEYLNHGWWEQRALHDELGYGGAPLAPPAGDQAPELYRRTCFLDNGWSVHCRDQQPVAHPRVMQATMWPDRAGIMREWAAARQPASVEGVTTARR